MTTLHPGDTQAWEHPRAIRLALPEGHVMHGEDRQRPTDRRVVLVLHGGPGSSISPGLCRQVESAGPYRVISFDQRGCGHSLPRGSTDANTTAHLVADIERLREHLGISSWLVVGGSWGATLAIAYASQHRNAVEGLVLRGLFVPSPTGIRQFFHRAMVSTPAAPFMPASARSDVLPWLHAVFHGGDASLQSEAAWMWHAWEQRLSGRLEPPSFDPGQTTALIARYRVQSHYLMHACWLGTTGLRHAAGRLRGVPTVFLHGLSDETCPADAARQVQRACPGSAWVPVAGVGHDPFAEPMARAIGQCLHAHAATGQMVTAQVVPA